MDDATRLIADLEEKLADLDHKVATYRQGLADEFTRHEHRLLRDVPETLCATVKGSVARSLDKYPAISPALARAPAGALAAADSPKPCSGAATPTPTPAAAADADADATAAAAPTATAPASTGTSASTSTPPGPGTGATDAATSTAAPATAASRSADHEDSSPAAPRLPRPATPPPSLLPPPPPSPPAATDDPGHMSDSPAEDREAELRGLFTPTFLPLLDISINRMRPPPTPPKPRSPRNSNPMAAAAAATPKMDAADPARPGPGEARPSSSPQTCTQLPARPHVIRRATDDRSTSSVLSDKSDSKSRRSALRRSSSSSKPQSPRRVRFDVAGTEVLPTSSPSDTSQDLFRQPPSDGGYTAPALNEDDDPAKPRSVAAILGLNDAEDDEPPPKKVSSSQALRALSRLPLDSDTVWTPVTQESTPYPNPEGRGADAVKPNWSLKSETRAATSQGAEQRPVPAPASPPRRPAPLEVGRAKTHPGTPLRRTTESWDDSDESSDDDFLSIAKPRSFRNKASLVSSRPRSPSGDEESRPIPARRATTGTVPNKTQASRAPTPPPGVLRGGARQPKDAVPSAANQAQDEAPDPGPDYSDVFDFEESEGMPARPITPPREESESEPEDSRPQPRQAREPLQMYSTSPAVSVPGRRASQIPSGAEEVPAATPTSIPGTTPKSQVPAVGSYRGRAITMPVVVDPSVHEQAAAMGEFNSFVGSLDGRTGMDDGDVSSFRASIAAVEFGGTPRSLTQRMMLEERDQLRRKG